MQIVESDVDGVAEVWVPLTTGPAPCRNASVVFEELRKAVEESEGLPDFLAYATIVWPGDSWARGECFLSLEFTVERVMSRRPLQDWFVRSRAWLVATREELRGRGVPVLAKKDDRLVVVCVKDQLANVYVRFEPCFMDGKNTVAAFEVEPVGVDAPVVCVRVPWLE